MIFKQYYLGCLAHASYLIGDERTQTAVVVDPQRDIDQYLSDAEKMGLVIRHVFLTHFHADFVAGHLELRNRTGATIHLGSSAQAEYVFTPAQEGEDLEVGNVRLSFLETPGHTPEGLSILVYDLEESGDCPKMVLTGDTLFIGDVGRPDLMASVGVSAEELAGMLYESLHEKLLKLPDATLVYPAHGAGSLCGKNLSDDTVSTIGEQRALNYALRPMSREKFVEVVTENQPPAPEYFSYDAMLNRREHENLEDSLKTGLRALSVDELLERQESGDQILDTRSDSDFNAAHLKGALHVGLAGKFATWAGVVLQPDLPLVLIAEPGSEYEAEMRLGRIGFDNVSGYLTGGMNSLSGKGELIESVEAWTGTEFLRHLLKKEKSFILDVRSPREYETQHVKSAVNIRLNDLRDRLHEIPQNTTVVVHCAGGYRSTIACSLLKKAGYSRVVNLLGGLEAVEGLEDAAEPWLEKSSTNV